jgi:hypothetical protein
MARTRIMLFVFLIACSPEGEVDESMSDPAPGSLLLTPGTATIEVIDGVVALQAFTATVLMSDGSTIDVSESALFGVDSVRLGRFEGARFAASGVVAGPGVITAWHEGLSAQASIVVLVRDVRIGEGVPAAAAGWFDAAGEDPALAPEVVYPSDSTLVPPNLGELDVHWRDRAGNDLFEVAITSEFLDLRTYVTGSSASWVTIAPELWSLAGGSHRGGAVTVSVRGLRSDAPEMAGSAAPLTMRIAEQETQGGIYYWASRSTTGRGGIYRHDMGRAGEPAEPFYTTTESPDGRCVACHALSRDGTRMAITYDGGNGASTILDVGSRTPLLDVDGAFAWNFAAFDPEASRIVTGHKGTLTLRSVEDGMALDTVPAAGWATHPDFHPGGDAITYVVTTAPVNDWTFTGGSIVTQAFDPGTSTFGAPVTLVEGSDNTYYPSWSPDGDWILFNRSTENAYDDSSAELYVVKADGSIPPIRLDSANISAGLTNSWARWAPFEHRLGQGPGAEVFYWFTFSSKRDFGTRLVGARRPQIWMAPFFPARALAGQDPAGAAFRLPQQDITGNNHIAQWTEHVVPIK